MHHSLWPSVPVILTCINLDHVLQRSSLISFIPLGSRCSRIFEQGDFKHAFTYCAENLFFCILFQKKQDLTVLLLMWITLQLGWAKACPTVLLKVRLLCKLAIYWVCKCIHNQSVIPIMLAIYLHEHKFAKSHGPICGQCFHSPQLYPVIFISFILYKYPELLWRLLNFLSQFFMFSLQCDSWQFRQKYPCLTKPWRLSQHAGTHHKSVFWLWFW